MYAVTVESLAEAKKTTKRKRSKADSSVIEECVVDTLENLITEVDGVKEEVRKYRKLSFKHRFSLSFISSFEEAFKCAICATSPAKPPLIACSACSTLVGCQSCTNEWYKEGALDKRCPKCRAERGLAKTFVLRGFDDVVQQIKLMQEDENDESDALDDTLIIERD